MANRFWVGGAGTWDTSSTANWATSSGGSSGASAPTSGDTVTFDTLSGTGTCTTASGAVCSACTMGSLLVDLTLGSNLTMSGTFTLTNNTLTLGSNTLQCNIFSSNNANTRSIAFGTGQINVAGNGLTIFDFTTATGFTYTGTSKVNFTYSGSTGTRTLLFATGATESNVLNYNITAGSDLVAQPVNVKNLDYTGFSGSSLNNAATQQSIYGNLILSSTMTGVSGGAAIAFISANASQQITTNAITIDHPITIGVAGSTNTLQLQSALTVGSNRTLTLTSGTLDANNYNVTTGLFSSSNSNTRTLTMGSGTWTLSGTGTVWNFATTTNLTFNKNTANIVLSDTSTTARTFAGGGLTYNNLTIGGSTGISTLTFTGTNTFNTLASTKTVAHTITFPNVTTTVSDWTIKGTAGNVVTLTRTGASGTFTLAKSGGGVISGINYLSISNSTASPTNTWYAGANSTNGGGNTNWLFTSFYTSVISVTSTITNVFTKLLNKNISISSTVTLSGSLNSNALNSEILNGSILSNNVTVSLTTQTIFSKILSVTVNATISIARSLNRLITLLITSIVTSTLLKKINTTLSTSVSNIISLIKAIGKLLNASLSNSVTLTSAKFFYKVLSAISSATVTISNSYLKLLTITVNSVIILVKSINKYLNIISNASISLITNVVSFVNYAANKVIYAVPKLRSLAATRFITMVGTLKKVRSATTVKFRTLFIDKDLNI